MRMRRQQGGWTLLVVLIAVALVAFLARDSLLAYLGTASRAGSSLDSRVPPSAIPASDPLQSTPAPGAPVERARAVEDTLRQQFERTGRAVDAPR